MTDGDLRRSYTVITVESTGKKREKSRRRMQSEAAKIGADSVKQITTDAAYAGQHYNTYTGKTGGSKTRHICGARPSFTTEQRLYAELAASQYQASPATAPEN